MNHQGPLIQRAPLILTPKSMTPPPPALVFCMKGVVHDSSDGAQELRTRSSVISRGWELVCNPMQHTFFELDTEAIFSCWESTGKKITTESF